MPAWDGNKEGLERDLYEERRRKWRRSGFWRGILTVIVLLIALVTYLVMSIDEHPTGPHIARVSISGVIFGDREREEILAKIAADDDVKALIVWIDSPGGTVVGSEVLFEAIRRVAEHKPVVAQMNAMAASGGYIAAIGADYIVARSNTITGSIGVIMEYPDMTDMLETVGVEWQVVRSSDIKGGASPYRETTPEMRAAQEAMIAESFDWFRGLVGDRRGLDDAALDMVATGGIFSGRAAVENGLIDELGGHETVLAYLESVDPELASYDVEDWEVAKESSWYEGLLSTLLGINPLLERFSTQAGPQLYSINR